MDARALKIVQERLTCHLGPAYGALVGIRHPVTLPGRPMRGCSVICDYISKRTFGSESCIFHVNILIFRNLGCFRADWSLGEGKATSFSGKDDNVAVAGDAGKRDCNLAKTVCWPTNLLVKLARDLVNKSKATLTGGTRWLGNVSRLLGGVCEHCMPQNRAVWPVLKAIEAVVQEEERKET